MNSAKSLIFDITKILLPKRLVLTYSLIAKVMYHQILFAELKSSYQFLSYFQFCLGSYFPKLSSGCSSEWKNESPSFIISFKAFNQKFIQRFPRFSSRTGSSIYFHKAQGNRLFTGLHKDRSGSRTLTYFQDTCACTS